MSIITDSYSIRIPEPGFVLVEYTSVMDTAVGQAHERSSLWFERDTISLVADSLKSFLETEWGPEIVTRSGQDHVRVYESGPEQAPYVNLENVRAKDAPHGGFHWVAMSRGLAQKLQCELAELARRSEDGPS